MRQRPDIPHLGGPTIPIEWKEQEVLNFQRPFRLPTVNEGRINNIPLTRPKKSMDTGRVTTTTQTQTRPTVPTAIRPPQRDRTYRPPNTDRYRRLFAPPQRRSQPMMHPSTSPSSKNANSVSSNTITQQEAPVQSPTTPVSIPIHTLTHSPILPHRIIP